MFRLRAQKNILDVLERESVTSGSVNVYDAAFEFSSAWDGLERTAVFRAGKVSRAQLLDETGRCSIPWEVLERPGEWLYAGVYGTLEGKVVLPTIWTGMGIILTGVDAPDGSVPPTPELWEQALERKGDTLAYTENGKLGLYSGEKLLSAVTVQGGGGGAAWGVGHGLKVVDGDLTVNSVNDFSGDNTLPMTAAGVQATVGNIEALLGTI